MLLDEVDRTVPRQDLHPDRRIGGQERHEHVGKATLQAERTGDAHETARLGEVRRGEVFGGGGAGADLLGMGENLLAEGRHREAAARALDEPGTEPVLQLQHPPREPGFRNPRGAGGGGESAVLGHQGEEREIAGEIGPSFHLRDDPTRNRRLRKRLSRNHVSFEH